MRNATFRTALAVIAVLLITVCGILIVGRVVGRARLADLTHDNLYTLSNGTRNIVKKLNQPVHLTLYYSRAAARKGPEQIRYWNNYFLYVRDLLNEYVDRAGGKITLAVTDPRPYSEAEEEALRYGVKRFQLSQDEAFFFGLVASTELGKDEVIEFFEPERQEFVEYDVSKLLVSLMQRKKKKIGVIANVPIMGTDMSPYMMQMLRMQGRQPERPWTIVGHIQQNYEMEKVEIQEDDPKVPADVDFLMVVHPKGLDRKTQFAIDQYVMNGGKAMVFVDPHCLQDRPMMQQPQMQMQHRANSSLNDLTEAWGVRLEPDKIAVDRTLAVPVPLRPNASPVKFPPYLALSDDNVSKEEVVTASLHTMRMLYAGALTKIDGTGTEVRPLLQTSAVGTTWKPSSPFELQFPDPDTINKAITDGTEPIMLACIITGKFKTNFPDGFEVEVKDDEKEGDDEDKADGDKGEAGKKGEAAKPTTTEPAAKAATAAPAGKPATATPAAKPSTAAPAAKPATDTPAGKPGTAAPAGKEDEPAEPEKKMKHIEAVTEAAEGATVIVVADVDLLTDMLAYQNAFFGMAVSGDNSAFVFNTLDYLAGSDDLISVRSRGRYSRPFEVVDEIEREADKATAVEVKQINEQIEKYEKELKELGGAATEENIQLIQTAALEKRRAIEAKIREANKGLRRLQAKRREKVEALGFRLQMLNLTVAPLAILAIAIALAIVRWAQAKHYAARRT